MAAADGTDTADSTLLDVQGLKAGYGRRPVLFDVNMHVGKGEVVAMFGHNGAGKTTTLNGIFGRCRPTGGTVRFAGKDITRSKGTENVRRGMTLIPAEHFVFGDLTVLDNIKLGAFGNSTDMEVRMEQIYELFPILRDRKTQLAGTLSGGQQRMLSISIALMTGPRLLLLDEPSLGLSPTLVQQMMILIGRLAREQNVSVLLVEQNVVQTLDIVDRAYFMRGGRIILEERSDQLKARDSYWDLF